MFQPTVSHAFEDLPSVTVILPVRNEGLGLRKTLDAVLSQDYPKDRLEIIVADGMSNDGTRELVGSLQSTHPNLCIIDNPGRIVPTGLNAAIRQARGEIIVRVDGHTIIAPDYVRQCVTELRETGADNVGGKMTAIGHTRIGRAVAMATSSPFGVGNARFHYSDKREWVDTVYLGAWRKEVFEQVGLFSEEMVRDQDDEFNYRLREHGGKILLSPLIKSVYTPREDFLSLWRQYFQYGYWKVRVFQQHPAQMCPRQFVPAALVATVIIATLAALVPGVGCLALGAVLGTYSVANLVCSVHASARSSWEHLPILPLVYATLHFSYGCGFLVGLVRFADRWGKAKSRPSERRRDRLGDGEANAGIRLDGTALPPTGEEDSVKQGRARKSD